MRLAAFGALVTLVVTSTGNLPAAAAPPRSDQAAAVRAKAEPALRQQLAEAETSGKDLPFWVVLGATADLAGSRAISAKAEKGGYVYRALTEHASRTQAGLRALLAKRGVEFEPFWIANTIKVTGDAELLAEVAARPEVSEVLADTGLALPEPVPNSALDVPPVNGVEWNVDRIGAPLV